MRLSAVMLLCSLAGIIGGAALIGVWCVGLAIIFDSLAVGVFAWFRDDGKHAAPVQLRAVPTLRDILEREQARP